MCNQHDREDLLLSIVIPAYNSEKFISRTLNSLVNQSVGAACYEIIVVDDGSTDRTMEICQGFAKNNENIQVVHQENRGVSAARNYGIALARGRWITFVDSDDYVMPHYVQVVTSTAPDADYVIFDNYLDAGAQKKREKTWLDAFFDQMCQVSRIMHWICDQRLNAPWDKRFLLNAVKEKRVCFDDSLSIGEDLLFNYQYLTHVSTVFICRDLVYVHTDNPAGLCNMNLSGMAMNKYELLYKRMLSVSAEKEETIPYQKVIKQSFLRIIFRYAGQLFREGWRSGEIAENMDNREMVQQILDEPADSFGNQVRKRILRSHIYWLCMVLTQKE